MFFERCLKYAIVDSHLWGHKELRDTAIYLVIKHSTARATNCPCSNKVSEFLLGDSNSGLKSLDILYWTSGWKTKMWKQGPWMTWNASMKFFQVDSMLFAVVLQHVLNADWLRKFHFYKLFWGGEWTSHLPDRKLMLASLSLCVCLCACLLPCCNIIALRIWVRVCALN